MRPIHLVRLDKTRPAVILTREDVRPHMARITVAPVTSRVRGLATEVPLGNDNGLDHACVVSGDNIATVEAADIGRLIGFLLPDQETDLTVALIHAFDLALPE